MRVVVAEDHYLVREGICRLLADSGEVEVVERPAAHRSCSPPSSACARKRC